MPAPPPAGIKPPHRHRRPGFARRAGLVILAAWSAVTSLAAVPPAEKLLPDDTLLLVSVPEFAKLRALFRQTPQGRLWRDPAMKPFVDRFNERINEQLLAPLERELSVRWADCESLPQGQVTFALVPNHPAGDGPSTTATLLLLDAGNRSNQLTRTLAELKKKWVDSGRTLHSEKIRDREFTVLLASANDVPKDLKDALNPPRTFIDPTGANQPPTPVVVSGPEAQAAATKRDWFVGQVDSLLVVGTAAAPIERMLARLGGAPMPALEDVAAFAEDRRSLLRDAPVFGWINPKPFMDVLTRSSGNRPEPPDLTRDAPENVFFLTVGTAKFLAALGFGSVKSFAFSLRESSEGSTFDVSARAPEAERTGLLKLLAGESIDSGPPAYVPADATGFWRWRLNGAKAWTALNDWFTEMNPQFARTFNWVVDSAAEAAKQKDPDFDLRKLLLASLGDDLVGYQKAAPADAPGASLGRSLYVLGSPQPEQLAAALKALFVLLPQADGVEAEREFLGRKIRSAILPVWPGSEPPRGGPRILFYAAAPSGVAMSTDAGLLEEYLRGIDNRSRPLRELPAFTEAAPHVVGAGASWLSYENRVETLRAAFEALKRDTNNAVALSALIPLPGGFDPLKDLVNFRGWMDVSLLPPYERIAKYFSVNVAAMNVTTDGISLHYFAPNPREAKPNP